MNENEKKQRIGNQKPTVSHTLEYQKTDAETAINLYEQTGKTVQKWQSQLLYDILAKNDEGLWTHTKFGYSVPTHPHNGDNVPSASDREAIGLLESITGQNTSKIVTTDGKVTVFNKYGVINVETVDNTMSDEYKKCLKNFLEVNKYVVYW